MEGSAPLKDDVALALTACDTYCVTTGTSDSSSFVGVTTRTGCPGETCEHEGCRQTLKGKTVYEAAVSVREHTVYE
jgi:hypothetical protein